MLEDVSTKKERSYILRRQLRREIKRRGKNRPGIEKLRHGRTIAPTRNHHRHGALMIAAIGIMMERLMKVRGSGERSYNQELTDEQASECLPPTGDVANSRHSSLYNALPGPWQRMISKRTPGRLM